MENMGADQGQDWQLSIASALEWWRDAGVDVELQEAPRDWLARIPAPAAPAPFPFDATAPAAPAIARAPMPDTLAAFEAWRIGADAPDFGWSSRRFAGSGSAVASGLMVLVDMPERDDSDRLLDGAAGRLFDRMLAAVGHSRESVYLAPLCVARPVSGQIPSEVEAGLAEIAWRWVELVAPKRLLLLGNAPSRALAGANVATGRGCLSDVNRENMTMQAVSSYHPRFLLEQPARKADTWIDLQLWAGGIAS
jgi:uracil-DNA glycosylase